jgi:hypothetical protein
MRLFEVLDIGLDTSGPKNVMQILSAQLDKKRESSGSNIIPYDVVQGMLAPFDLPLSDVKGLQDFFKNFDAVKEVTSQGDVVLNVDDSGDQAGQQNPETAQKTVDKMAKHNANTLGR